MESVLASSHREVERDLPFDLVLKSKLENFLSDKAKELNFVPRHLSQLVLRKAAFNRLLAALSSFVLSNGKQESKKSCLINKLGGTDYVKQNYMEVSLVMILFFKCDFLTAPLRFLVTRVLIENLPLLC